MQITLDHPAKVYFLFQAIILQNFLTTRKKLAIYSANLIWNHLQNKYSNYHFMKLAPKVLKSALTQKLMSLHCEQ